MPNWCYTDYRCYGNKGELVELKEKLDYLNSLPAPYSTNGFGKLWCGCLVELLDGDINEVHCRGEVDSYEFSGTTLCMTVMSAWSELGEWRRFIKSKFPNISIVYRAEEPGNIYYETNDVKGAYFPDRYILDFIEGPEYFKTLDDAAGFVSRLTGKVVTTEEEIDVALEELEEKELGENEDVFYCFNKYKVNEEDLA